MPHIHEKIDMTVETFIVHKNKVLLRLHDKYKIWLAVGGHIELDEDPNQAAIREVKEEVGLDVILVSPRPLPTIPETDNLELVPPWFSGRHPINETHEHVYFVYFAKATTDKLFKESVTDECVWVNKEELQSMDLKPHIKFYAEAALEFLGK